MLNLALTLLTLSFTQTIDPAAANRELQEFRNSSYLSMGESLDMKKVDEEVAAKARAYTTKVDLGTIPALQAADWAQIFYDAKDFETSQSLAKRFLESKQPNPQIAYYVLARASTALSDADGLIQVVREADTESLELVRTEFIYNGSDMIEGVKGSQAALDALENLEKKVATLPAPTGFRAIMAETQKAVVIDKKANYLVNLNRREEALKLIDDTVTANKIRIDQSEEKPPANIQEKVRSLKEKLKENNVRLVALRQQLQVRGLVAPAMNETEKIGSFPGLEAWKGKVVIVDFFAHWCGPCKASFPDMKKMYADLHDKGLEILGATGYYGSYEQEQNLTKDVEFSRMKGFMKDHALPWPLVFVPKETMTAYGVASIPHVAVIGKDGTIHKIKVGYSADTFAAFRKSVEKLLAE